MKIINIASGNSVWRGIDYYNQKKLFRIIKSMNFDMMGK